MPVAIGCFCYAAMGQRSTTNSEITCEWSASSSTAQNVASCTVIRFSKRAMGRIQMRRILRWARQHVAAPWVLLLCACTASSTRTLPVQELLATWDSSYVERGRHLIFGPARCAECHGNPTSMLDGNREPTLGGGRVFNMGIAGSLVAPNISAHSADGIGALSDATLARALRHGVDRHGRRMFPIMATEGLSDYDVQAILSYLRGSEAEAGWHDSRAGLSWFGKAIAAMGLHARHRRARPPALVALKRSGEHGRYLAEAVGGCRTCHTGSGGLVGFMSNSAPYGGRTLRWEGDSIHAPALRGARSTVAQMTERDFIALFRTRAHERSGSPMPWAAFGRMTDDELGAIYLYLRDTEVHRKN